MLRSAVRRLLVLSVATSSFLAVAVAPIVEATSAPLASAGVRGACGVWRWDVKTLSDPDRTGVNFTPQQVTVQSLRTMTEPGSLGTHTPRIAPLEEKTFTVNARVISATIEDDSDIHLVIAQRGTRIRTMIVEFPDPSCVASPFKRDRIRQARSAMLSNCGPISSSHFTNLDGNVVVTGVGFWDEIHGQTGVAPNGIELHPVLGFTGDCHPATGGGGGGGGGNCSPSYPDFCIPPPPPDLDCADIPHNNFTVLPPDPHGFDGDHDGVGCET